MHELPLKWKHANKTHKRSKRLSAPQTHSSSVVHCTPVRREMHIAEPVTLIHLIVIT